MSGRQKSNICKIFMEASEINSYITPLRFFNEFLVSRKFLMENVKPGRNLGIRSTNPLTMCIDFKM